MRQDSYSCDSYTELKNKIYVLFSFVREEISRREETVRRMEETIRRMREVLSVELPY